MVEHRLAMDHVYACICKRQLFGCTYQSHNALTYSCALGQSTYEIHRFWRNVARIHPTCSCQCKIDGGRMIAAAEIEHCSANERAKKVEHMFSPSVFVAVIFEARMRRKFVSPRLLARFRIS